jgi:hypothetical protein
MERIIEHIEKMKEKPEHVRKQYAFLIAFSFSFLIFAGWMASYTIHPNATQAKVDKPLKSLTASVSDAFKDVKDIFVGTNKFEYKDPVNVEVKAGKR